MKLITLYNLCQFFKKELEVTKGVRIKKIVNRSSQGKKVTLLLKILEICNCEELRMLHILDPDYFWTAIGSFSNHSLFISLWTKQPCS